MFIIRRVAIGINGAVIFLAALFYKMSVDDLADLTFRLHAIEKGFNALNSSHSKKLESARAFISGKIGNGYLDKIDNDSLVTYILVQSEVGQHYTHYQDGIRYEILEISEDIIVSRKQVGFAIACIVILALFNLAILFILNRKV